MIAKGTIYWIAIPLLIGIFATVASIQYKSFPLYFVANAFFLIAILMMLFYRDPPRAIGKGVVSPADGKVLRVDQKRGSLSIFMNIHNVHVNRAPIGGRVLKVERFSGRHSPAYSEKAEKNERVETTIMSKIGPVKVIQTAGLVARRIIPYVRPGMYLQKGQRIGMIAFGSGVTVEMPESVRMIVKKGQKVKAGETSIGVVVYDLA
ncbi:MAG: phosphatidylserine decarboxylase [Methanobacteriota archaeon]|nr:MAG: phosphatidylserine decarboxylase [Euryarchaeota archaeon]